MSTDLTKSLHPRAYRKIAASKLWRSVNFDASSSNRPALLRRLHALFDASRATVLELRHDGTVVVLHAGCVTAAHALGVGAHRSPVPWEIANDNALPDAVHSAASLAASQSLSAHTSVVLHGIDHEVVATRSGYGEVLCVLRASPGSPSTAHDLNNCLTALTCAASALLDTPALGDDARGLAEIVHDALNRASALTRQLLTHARPERVAATPVDLGRELLSMTPLLRRSLPASVGFVAEIDPDMPTARLLPGHLQRVVMNLVSNASRAVSDRGHITLSAWGDSNGSGTIARAVIEVRDNGCGMPPEVLARAFEPWFTSRAEGGGHGLGLSTVRALVQESGGTVTIESRVGEGTTVTVTLPAWVPRVSDTLDRPADNDG